MINNHFLSCLISFHCRYGTTTFIFPPYAVLHTELLGNDPVKIKEAVESKEPPKVIIVPYEGMSVDQAHKMLQDSGLWIL